MQLHAPILIRLSLLYLVNSETISNTIEISTNQGTIIGAVDSNNVASFKGIPYAKPPIGSKRFALAEINETQWEYTLDATEYGCHCIQTEPSEEYKLEVSDSSEDCLNLNVWTKSPFTSTSAKPVMVWIHGGSYKRGSGNRDSHTNQSQTPKYQRI